MSASIREIARAVGVNHAVVSRLFRGDPALRISQRRRDEIFQTRERLGGVKVRAKRLSHLIVSPVVPRQPETYIKEAPLEHPSYFAFARELKEQGFELRIEPVEQAASCRWVNQWLGGEHRPDGMLIQTNYCTEELADLLRKFAVPHVSNDFTRENMRINTVCHHATAGIRQAVEHLAKLGHRRIAFAGPTEQYRRPMMVSAMAVMGLSSDPKADCVVPDVVAPYKQSHVRQLAAGVFGAWRLRNPEVTALICSNDYVALGVIDALREIGLVPGRDLSVVGYDNIEEQSPQIGHRPILTTVHNPFERVGRRMAELLLNQIMYGQTAIIHERVPVSLVVRESTGPVLDPAGSLS